MLANLLYLMLQIGLKLILSTSLAVLKFVLYNKKPQFHVPDQNMNIVQFYVCNVHD